MRKYALSVAVVLALAFSASACSGSGPAAPSPTDPPPGPGPKDGPITIVYAWRVGKTCPFAKTDPALCEKPPKVRSRGWPEGYGLHTPGMTCQADGSCVVQEMAPSMPPPARLYIYIIDTWLCDPAGGGSCGEETIHGRGVTINGVRLPDGKDGTCFSFVPPTVTAPATIEGC